MPTNARRQALMQDVRDTMSVVSEPTMAVWAIYIVLVPIYLWSSGLPQPGDWMLLFLAPLTLRGWRGKLPANTEGTWRAVIVFTGYVVLVNLIWSVVLNQWSMNLKQGFWLSATFYIYNALMYLIVLVLYTKFGERFLWFTAKILIAALLLQALLSFVSTRGGLRATVLFNNPNQLGYYALVSVSLLFLLERRSYVSSLEVTLGTVAASYLALISASKAALGAIGLLVIAGLLVRLRTMLSIGVVFLLLLYVPSPMQDAIDRTLTRFDNDVSLGFFEERGYDRIWNHPEHWVMGAGEGGYLRFSESTAIRAHEIHSSVGTLFFSYGIVGTTIFAVFTLIVLRRKGLRTWLLVLPTMAYGMTHQGLRTTLFWVLLAIVAIMGNPNKQRGPPR